SIGLFPPISPTLYGDAVRGRILVTVSVFLAGALGSACAATTHAATTHRSSPHQAQTSPPASPGVQHSPRLRRHRPVHHRSVRRLRPRDLGPSLNGAASICAPNPLRGVYHPSRLKVLGSCRR